MSTRRMLTRLWTRFRSKYEGRPFRTLLDTARYLATVHLVTTYGFSWGNVSGPSMLPDWEIYGMGTWVSHLHRRGDGIRVGDIVRYKIPINNQEGIKRVGGLPGDYVLVHSPNAGPGHMIQVPEGHCWLLGDNLGASRDSRVFGPVPLALVDGKVIIQTGSYFWDWSSYKKVTNPFDVDQGS